MKVLFPALCAILLATPALAKNDTHKNEKSKASAGSRAPKSDMPPGARGMPSGMMENSEDSEMPPGAVGLPSEMDPDEVSLEDRVFLLRKLTNYKGKVSGTTRGNVQTLAAKLLGNRKDLADAQFYCSQHSPTLDDGQKRYIMDCTVFVDDKNGKPLILNFGTNGHIAKIAKITDVNVSPMPDRPVGLPPMGEHGSGGHSMPNGIPVEADDVKPAHSAN